MNESPIIDYLDQNSPESQREAVTTFLHTYNTNNHFLSIYLMNVPGTTTASTDPTFVGKNFDFRDYFQKAVRGEKYFDLAIGTVHNELGYYYASPVKNNEGTILGVLVLKIRPSVIEDVILIAKYQPSLSTMLVDDNGIVFHSNKSDKVYKVLGKVSEEKEREIVKSKKLNNAEKIESLSYDPVLQDLPNITDDKTFSFYDEKDGENEFLRIQKIPGTKFYFITEEEQEEYVAVAEHIAISLAISFILISLVASTLISKIISSLFKPLKILDTVAKEIGKGNFDARADIQSNDELESLGNTFNVMADNIKGSTASIEAKVKERTAELQKLNDFMIGRELKMIELKKEIDALKTKSENK